MIGASQYQTYHEAAVFELFHGLALLEQLPDMKVREMNCSRGILVHGLNPVGQW